MKFDMKNFDTKQLSFDVKKLQNLFSSTSSEDINRFLEKLPHNAGHTVLIAAGIVWALAAAGGLYTSIQLKELTELRGELKATKALKPIVPVIKNVGVPPKELERFVERAKASYRGIKITSQGSEIVIAGSNTSNFTEFREAISHVLNGGKGWKVSISKMCVGRECKASQKLTVSMKINKVSVEKP